MKIGAGKVVRLYKSLYGTKNASHLWWEDLRQELVKNGFVQSKTGSMSFYFEERQLYLYVMYVC